MLIGCVFFLLTSFKTISFVLLLLFLAIALILRLLLPTRFPGFAVLLVDLSFRFLLLLPFLVRSLFLILTLFCGGSIIPLSLLVLRRKLLIRRDVFLHGGLSDPARDGPLYVFERPLERRRLSGVQGIPNILERFLVGDRSVVRLEADRLHRLPELGDLLVNKVGGATYGLDRIPQPLEYVFLAERLPKLLLGIRQNLQSLFQGFLDSSLPGQFWVAT